MGSMLPCPSRYSCRGYERKSYLGGRVFSDNASWVINGWLPTQLLDISCTVTEARSPATAKALKLFRELC